jgi:DNA mismatch repair protein MutS
MTTIDEYFKIYDQYYKTYGDRICFIMQIGSFYNMYEYTDEDTKETIGTVSEIAKLLNLRITLSTTKNVHSRFNPYMCGIPCVAFDDKYREFILKNNFTIIKYNQSDYDKTKRVLSEIVSPSTDQSIIITDDNIVSNQIMSIYIECLNNPLRIDNIKVLCGVSSIDVATGKNKISELYTNEKDTIYVYQELYRIINTIKPRELLISINSYKRKDDEYINYVKKILHLDNYPIVVINCNEIENKYLDNNYQEQFLLKIFKGIQKSDSIVIPGLSNLIGLNKGYQISIFQELNIDKLNYGIISYIKLLQYCYEHDTTILHKISKPSISWLDEETHMILTHNAIDQLHLLPSISKQNYRLNKKNNYNSLLSVIDETNTSMGKRALKLKMLSPYKDVNIIKNKYNITEFFYNDKNFTARIIPLLKQMSDIEKLYTKLNKGIIKPKDFYNFYQSLKIAYDIINICLEKPNDVLSKIMINNTELLQLNSFLNYIINVFDLEILYNANLSDADKLLNSRECPINIGISQDADLFHRALKNDKDTLVCIKEHLSKLIPGSQEGKIKLDSVSKKVKKSRSIIDEENEEIINMNDLGLYLTKAKYNDLKNRIKDVDINLCGIISMEPINKKYSIKSDKIDNLCLNILNCMKNMGSYLYNFYKQIIGILDGSFTFYNNLINFIIELDVSISNSIVAHKYKYFKPEIDETEGIPSYFEIKNARHPIVERIINTEYISNDLTLGKIGNPHGVLLYGCNSTGKSTFTLSVGLNIIMAQMGMFIPSNLKFKPYHNIITRLTGNDDMLNGHSSFIVEMMELRTITKHTGMNTLVLGDELCRGTEAISAAAITIQAIKFLIDCNSSFIFSTHMHNLSTNKIMSDLRSKNKFSVCHLTSEYSLQNESLIYNRKLQDGSGDSIYGLEVAKYVGIDSNFIKEAYAIRKELLDENKEVLSSKKSRYNSRVYVDTCVICGNKLNLESHHLKEQHLVDEDGYVELTPINAEHNIIIICKKCHTTIHRDNLRMEQQQTSDGIKLKVEK